MSRPTIAKLANGNVQIATTNRHGDEIRNTMTETEAAAFVFDFLTKGLPNAGLTQILLGKTQG
jgi:hypothetical protein